MSSKTLFDIPNSLATALIEGHENSGGLATIKDVEQAAARFRNDVLNPATVKAVTISTSIATIKRAGRFTYVSIDTEGSSAADTMNEIADASTFSDFDLVFIKPVDAARQVTLETADPASGLGNLQLNTTTLKLTELHHAVVFMKLQDRFVEYMRFPAGTDIVSVRNLYMENNFSRAIASGVVEIDRAFQAITPEKTGGTASSFQIEIDTVGTSGTIDVWVNALNGSYSLGLYTYTGSPAVHEVRDALVAVLDADEYFSAVAGSGGIIDITAPVSWGAAPNSPNYTAELVLDGGAVVSLNSDFAGGVDPAEADDELATLDGIQEGQLLMLYNAAETDKTIRLVSGGNIDVSTGSLAIAQNRFVLGVVIDSFFRPLSTDGLDGDQYIHVYEGDSIATALTSADGTGKLVILHTGNYTETGVVMTDCTMMIMPEVDWVVSTGPALHDDGNAVEFNMVSLTDFQLKMTGATDPLIEITGASEVLLSQGVFRAESGNGDALLTIDNSGAEVSCAACTWLHLGSGDCIYLADGKSRHEQERMLAVAGKPINKEGGTCIVVNSRMIAYADFSIGGDGTAQNVKIMNVFANSDTAGYITEQIESVTVDANVEL